MKTTRYRIIGMTRRDHGGHWGRTMLEIAPTDTQVYAPGFEVEDSFIRDLPYTDQFPASKGKVGYEFDLTIAPVGTPEPDLEPGKIPIPAVHAAKLDAALAHLGCNAQDIADLKAFVFDVESSESTP